MALNHASLHHAIISGFLDREHPPTIAELAMGFGCDSSLVRTSLRALAEHHGAVLHPQSDEVWVAHPFSAAPTTCVVRAGTKRWWGNCIWCSLGIAHLAGGTAQIETRLGALDDTVTIRLEHGEILDTDLVVHFPIPMRNAWDNVLYTCSVMLPFRSAAAVEAWCVSRGIPMGDVRPITHVWRFAIEWYGRHADADWRKWSVQEATEIFARHGLTGPTWTLTDAGERF